LNFNSRKESKMVAMEKKIVALEDTRDHYEEPEDYRRPKTIVRWARDAVEDGPATEISTTNISHGNSGSVRYGGREVQHRPERGYDKSSKMAAPSWQRKKQIPVSADEDEKEMEHQYSPSPEPPLTSPKSLPPKKLLMKKKKFEELEHRRHMKERWNCEYDKRVTVAGDYDGNISEKRRKDWAASDENYSDYLSSNEEGRPSGHPRYAKHEDSRYDDAGEGEKLQRRHYPSEADGRPPRPISSSSYPYQSEPSDKDIDLREAYHRHQRYLAHHQNKQGHRAIKPIPPRTDGHSSYQPYQDDPRDVDTRRPTAVVASTVKVTPAEVFPSTAHSLSAPLKQRALQAAGPKAAGGYANTAAQGRQYRGRQPRSDQDGYVSVEDKDGKTTYYHYEDVKEDIGEKQEVVRKGRAHDRSYSLLEASSRRKPSRESESSASSEEERHHGRQLPLRLQSSRRMEEAARKERTEKTEKSSVDQVEWFL
jgi:hypothetical protein